MQLLTNVFITLNLAEINYPLAKAKEKSLRLEENYRDCCTAPKPHFNGRLAR